MKQYLLRTAEKFQPSSETQYINDCCRYCDILLEKLKPAISEKMNVDLNGIAIGQEDWGWYLEFPKDEIFCEINVSYQGENEAKEHEFGITVEAGRVEKGFFFDKKIEAVEEREEISKIVGIIAKENNLEIFEE